MEKIKEVVLNLPKDNKQKIFYDFRTNLRFDWSEMEDIVQYIRRKKQVQVSLIRKMPFDIQIRLACYLYYDEVNPVVHPPVIQKKIKA